MTDRRAYPAADLIAPKLHDHFARHIDEARKRDDRQVASLPAVGVIAAVVDAAFWASLRHEEGYAAKISLAILAPAESAQPMVFERPLPLDPAALAKVAPAVERAGIHLGVSPEGDVLRVWGTTWTIPAMCFVLEVAGPGLLVVKHHRGEESQKFVNVAVLEGDEIKLVDEQASSLPDCPPMVTSLLGFDAPTSWADSVNVLVQMAVSMRAHHRGGLLLMVPTGSDKWRESIVRPLPYAAVPAFSALADLKRAMPDQLRSRAWQDALARSIDAVAGFTAVDGATILTTEYEVLGFGAKIMRKKGAALVGQVMLTEPIAGSTAETLDPAQLGGTRHLSAAQFVHDQRDSLALVASQDGRFTIFAWSECEGMVHAHRVETLLL
jgi:sensor domain DACNV-containing protein